MKTPQLPFPKLSEALSIKNDVWLKREDKHNYGSHKGRAIPMLIKQYNKEGVREFIVSSSGNAAYAAVKAVQAANQNNPGNTLSVTVLVGNKISPQKLEALKKEIADPHVTLVQVDNPKQQAFQLEKEGKGKWLRQSTDDNALLGYTELAKELSKIENLAAVFVPTSSGTTAQGLYEGFKLAGINPQIHIIQTPACHPIVDVVTSSTVILSETKDPSLDSERNSSTPLRSAQNDKTVTTASLATAIVDNVAHRKEKVAAAVRETGGAGWIATDDDIRAAIKITREHTGIETSPNSALSVAGLMLAVKAGMTWSGPVVCLVTGP